MPGKDLTPSEQRLVKSLVKACNDNRQHIELFHNQLLLALRSSCALSATIHSMRSRIKAPDHLEDKLVRKIHDCKRENLAFEVTPDNLLVSINDLVGVRLLHLYTRQISAIDAALREVLTEAKYDLLEGPFARTWDDESRQFFKSCNIETQESPTMYTSVHYIIGSASRTTVTAEIQVRTLMEEVWGEVDHTINYPHQVESVACREQLKVLARVTSSASRLVDSIFVTSEDHHGNKNKKTPSAKRARKG